MRENAPETALTQAAMRGDRAAFGALYERHARMVHGILLAHVPHADAQDLAQEVFLIALRRISNLKEAGAFGGWLAAIARNLAKDFHRRNKPAVELDPERFRQDTPKPEAFLVLGEIRDLPECYRETLTLRLVEGLTGPEIAERTGLTADSVRVNLCRGMKLLRERLDGARSHE